MRTLLDQPFLRFLITGGIAAGVNVLARLAISLMLPYEIAVVIAYLIGMSVAFILARSYVFAFRNGVMSKQYFRFGLVNVVALFQVWIVSVGLARVAFPWVGFDWYAETVAHVIGVLSPAVTSYFGHKHYSFR